MVGKGLGIIAVVLVIVMLKSSYQSRLMIAGGLIVGFAFIAMNKRKR